MDRTPARMALFVLRLFPKTPKEVVDALFEKRGAYTKKEIGRVNRYSQARAHLVDRATAYHRQALCAVDATYRRTIASQEVVRRRNALYEKGGGPNDPDLPTLSGILGEAEYSVLD